MTPFGKKLHDAGLFDEAKTFEAAVAAWEAAPNDEDKIRKLLGIWARARRAYRDKTGEPITPRGASKAAEALARLFDGAIRKG